MDKIQINIPSPMLVTLKRLAKSWDRSTSEVIRMAIERLLNQVPEDIRGTGQEAHFPTFDMGAVLIPADKMRDLLNHR